MITSDQIDALAGSTVIDDDGDKVGEVEQVYLSTDGGEPLFVTVKTGFFGTRESFVPLDDAIIGDDGLHVHYDKSRIKDAPQVDADGQLSDEEQQALFDYYGTDLERLGADDAAGTVPTAGDRATGDRAMDDRPAGDRAVDGRMTAGDRDPAAADTAPDAGRELSGRTDRDAGDSLTLSEERVHAGVERTERGRARLRKHVVTEQQTVTVPVRHDEVRVEREPIADGDAAADGAELSDEEHEVVLTEERPVVEKETVPVERVRLATESVEEQREVTQDVRHEELDTDGVDDARR